MEYITLNYYTAIFCHPFDVSMDLFYLLWAR